MGVIQDALEALARTTGLRGNIGTREPALEGDLRAETVIELDGQGKHHTFVVEVKTVDRAATLAMVKERFAQLHGAGLLVAPYITTELADRCRRLDLPFIDTAGNAYLRAPGLHVFVKGEKRAKGDARIATGSGGTATALRVVFALLCKPELLNAPYRAIVEAAGVALGAVGGVLLDLARRGYIAGGKQQRNRCFLETHRLIDEWVTNYPIHLRPKLNPRRFRAKNPGWWKNAELPEGAYWGGEVAADRLTDDLKPATYTIYLDPADGRQTLAQLAATHRFKADPEGEIELLSTFWHLKLDNARPDLVPPLLVYADLIGQLDPRNLEAATQVRGRFISHAHRRA